jgi:alpha-tubulin suppressor-like RCC1 family protein
VLALLAGFAGSAQAITYHYRVATKGVKGPPPAAALGGLTGLADFGNVVEGDTVSRSFTFTNTGSADALAVFAAISALPGLALSANSCGTAEATTTVGYAEGMNSCTLTVAFTPPNATTSLEGGTVSVGGTFTGSPSTLALSGQAAPLTVTLASAALPAGRLGHAYNNGAGFDLKTLLATNSASTDVSLADWSIAAGSPPPGITLSDEGVLSGVPSATTNGANFTVVANYKTKTGQQAYSLQVGEILLQATQIAARNGATCAVTTAGGLKCWGDNSNGKLGIGNTAARVLPTDVVGLTSGVASVAMGAQHTCALLTSGGLKCWGLNSSGQLGNGTASSSALPVDVSGLSSGVAEVSLGSAHTCARTTAGGAKCWGANNYFQLGDVSSTPSSTPKDVYEQTSGVARITTGANHSCLVTTTGRLICWGRNDSGQLGNGNTINMMRPDGYDTGIAQVVAGDNHSCVLSTTGRMSCSGLNTEGQTGTGSGNNIHDTFWTVSGLGGGVVKMTAGANHACAILNTGEMRCWGRNTNGQLGNGNAATQMTPVPVSGMTSGVAQASAGDTHTCAVLGTGAAKCWGNNSSSQLGDGTSTSKLMPEAVRM